MSCLINHIFMRLDNFFAFLTSPIYFSIPHAICLPFSLTLYLSFIYPSRCLPIYIVMFISLSICLSTYRPIIYSSISIFIFIYLFIYIRTYLFYLSFHLPRLSICFYLSIYFSSVDSPFFSTMPLQSFSHLQDWPLGVFAGLSWAAPSSLCSLCLAEPLHRVSAPWGLCIASRPLKSPTPTRNLQKPSPTLPLSSSAFFCFPF